MLAKSGKSMAAFSADQVLPINLNANVGNGFARHSCRVKAAHFYPPGAHLD